MVTRKKRLPCSDLQYLTVWPFAHREAMSVNGKLFAGIARREFLTDVAVVGGIVLLAPWAAPAIAKADAVGAVQDSPTGFDPQFALDVPLPLCLAAYAVEEGGTVILPPGYVQTALIQVDRALATITAERHPTVTRIAVDTNIFGLMGRNAATRTAFVAFRGTDDFDDVLTDLDIIPERYALLSGFGHVHAGFQTVYRLVRGSIAANIAAACVGCDQILVTGHSLGAAMAVLAAPDIFLNMPPNIQPRLITFAGPRPGLCDFAKAFNNVIKSCFRVVNFLDIVPCLPPLIYVQVGTQIDVDSGGPIDPISRHSLFAYREGLERLIKQAW
ncbi:lipase family protein [Mycobacterium xenopi]|uniref:lipase family protein n=1 Tax=Mycobacterium xenopi TaxID=1789 RepID=UPI0022EAD457|nr:lipase family protein [Mycobacterium xenopi]MDA3660037.1 lipase family protein [Mycobacterium xenopi]